MHTITLWAALAVSQSPTYLPVGSEAPNLGSGPVQLREMTKQGSTFVIFWKDRCPHNRRANPLYNQIFTAYEGKARFLGVIAPATNPNAWGKPFQVKYPLISLGVEAPKSYQLSASICVFEVGTDGRVKAVFPGYGQTELKRLNRAVATSLNVEPAPLDFKEAPQETTWGCTY